MDRSDFLYAVGDTLTHFTPAQNAGGIRALGLMPPATLAALGGIDPARLLLRHNRLEFTVQGHNVHLNHQRPLLMGRGKDALFLDGYTLATWSAQLDTRIFFWRGQQGDAFAQSLPAGTQRFDIDAGALFDAFAEHLFVSPINSGNAARRPAMRGDWLYIAATDRPHLIRENRKRRGLVQNRDTVKELSLTCPIPPDMLKVLCK